MRGGDTVSNNVFCSGCNILHGINTLTIIDGSALCDGCLVAYNEGRIIDSKPKIKPIGAIRTFDSGATRDTTQGKLDYVKGLSPIVLRRYLQYLDKHRLQPDGNMRDFNNWKKGIPQETYHSSKGRHFMAAWLIEEGYEVSDNHGPINEEDALCGELFNTMGKLHEILKVRLELESDYQAAVDHETGDCEGE